MQKRRNEAEIVTDGERRRRCISRLHECVYVRVCVCVFACVPRQRQTLTALSELTGPSPLSLLVVQGGRGEEDSGYCLLTNCL